MVVSSWGFVVDNSMLTPSWRSIAITPLVHALVTQLSGLMALLQTSLTPTSVCFLLKQTRSNAAIRAPSDRGHLTTGNSRSEIQPSEGTNAVPLGPDGDNSGLCRRVAHILNISPSVLNFCVPFLCSQPRWSCSNLLGAWRRGFTGEQKQEMH